MGYGDWGFLWLKWVRQFWLSKLSFLGNMFKKYWPARLQLPHQFVLGKGVGHTIDGHDRSVRKLPHCKSSTVKKYLAITSLKLPPYRTTSKLTFIHCEEGNSIHPASTGDFRVWTRFLRK